MYKIASSKNKVKEGSFLFDYSIVAKDKTERDYTIRSPLRYPGGKTRAVDIISKLIPNNIEILCSPFFGGGSLELAYSARGIEVFGYDIFSPLVEFWQCLQTDSNKLAKEVRFFYPLSKDRFYELQNSQISSPSKYKRAAIFYVLNRSSFSGATMSGGMSPNHPRFTLSSIKRIEEFYNPNFKVECSDFQDIIPEHKDSFLYLDPLI